MNLGVFLLPTPLTTYCRAFTTKLSSLSSMGTSPPIPPAAQPGHKNTTKFTETRILPEKNLSLSYTKTTLAERYGRVANNTTGVN